MIEFLCIDCKSLLVSWVFIKATIYQVKYLWRYPIITFENIFNIASGTTLTIDDQKQMKTAMTYSGTPIKLKFYCRV